MKPSTLSVDAVLIDAQRQGLLITCVFLILYLSISILQLSPETKLLLNFGVSGAISGWIFVVILRLQTETNYIRSHCDEVHDALLSTNDHLVNVNKIINELESRLHCPSIELEDDKSESVSRSTSNKASNGEISHVKKDISIAFSEDKVFPLEHRRLNNFANVKGITFQSVLGKLNHEQQEVFHRFSDQLTAALDKLDINRNEFYQIPDDFTRLRFLQADDYNIPLAIKRMCECIIWRQAFGVDRFLEEPNMKLLNRYRRLRVRRIVGMDKTGSPLIVERLGELIASEESFRGGLTMDQWVLCYSYDVSELMATFRECTELTGTYVHRVNYIGDLAGARISGAVRLISALKVMTKAVERNFPETAGNLILVNAPSYAGSVWNMIKRFLDPKTVARITILVGPSKEVLQKICGDAVLPIEFGGRNPYVVHHPLQRMDSEFERLYPLT